VGWAGRIFAPRFEVGFQLGVYSNEITGRSQEARNADLKANRDIDAFLAEDEASKERGAVVAPYALFMFE
jgi:hypothetical protein